MLRLPWPRDPRFQVREDGVVFGPSGRELRPMTWNDRPGVTVPNTWGGASRQRRYLVAWMVCETFYGPRPEGMEAAHEDGDVSNSRADNLSWKTCLENAADRERHGKTARGERQGAARLTEGQVREMRSLHASGAHSMSELAARYGVAKGTVAWAISRRSWAHVQ